MYIYIYMTMYIYKIMLVIFDAIITTTTLYPIYT